MLYHFPHHFQQAVRHQFGLVCFHGTELVCNLFDPSLYLSLSCTCRSVSPFTVLYVLWFRLIWVCDLGFSESRQSVSYDAVGLNSLLIVWVRVHRDRFSFCWLVGHSSLSMSLRDSDQQEGEGEADLRHQPQLL